ncbi:MULTISPECIES: hypothetical protein [Allobaculum]|uniref:hypothetical protein n=1 Tax=Allobaculum TaxID=174708 RepID=UPI001E4B8CB0|nr:MULTISPECIES: hypothetical protein [Allobaculum]UNT92248.1 hypothetical protein KWG61_08430 [Allobaculum sp. Allo2]
MTILQADFKSKQVVSADSSDKKPVIGVAGDSATRTIRFLLEKDVDELPKGISLNSITWEMQYENVNLQRGSVLPDSVKDEDGKLEIVFTIPASLAVAPGDCQIQLCGSGGDSKHWHLSPMTVQIGDFFEPDTIEETDPKYDLLNQLSAKVSQLEAADYLSGADAANTYLAKTDAADTYLAKEEAASKYVKNEAIGFNHFDIANMYGASTGTLYGGYSEYRFAITAEYEADVPVTFRGGGGQIMTTQNISSKSGMKYAAFFVVKDTKTGDVQILFGQGDSPIIDPLQSGVLSIYTFGSNDGYVDSVEVGPMPERIATKCAMRR